VTWRALSISPSAEEFIGQNIMKFCPDDEELVREVFKTLGCGNIIKVRRCRLKHVETRVESACSQRLNLHGHS